MDTSIEETRPSEAERGLEEKRTPYSKWYSRKMGIRKIGLKRVRKRGLLLGKKSTSRTTYSNKKTNGESSKKRERRVTKKKEKVTISSEKIHGTRRETRPFGGNYLAMRGVLEKKRKRIKKQGVEKPFLELTWRWERT